MRKSVEISLTINQYKKCQEACESVTNLFHQISKKIEDQSERIAFWEEARKFNQVKQVFEDN